MIEPPYELQKSKLNRNNNMTKYIKIKEVGPISKVIIAWKFLFIAF